MNKRRRLTAHPSVRTFGLIVSMENICSSWPMSMMAWLWLRLTSSNQALDCTQVYVKFW